MKITSCYGYKIVLFFIVILGALCISCDVNNCKEKLTDKTPSVISWNPIRNELVVSGDKAVGIRMFELERGKYKSKKIVDSNHEPQSLAWSPDGMKVCYEIQKYNEEMNYTLHMLEVLDFSKLGEKLVVSSPSQNAMYSCWASDGDRIFYTTFATSRDYGTLEVVNLNTGLSQQICKTDAVFSRIFYLESSESLIFSMCEFNRNMNICVLKIGAGIENLQIFKENAIIYDVFKESYLLYLKTGEKGNKGVMLVNLESGEENVFLNDREIKPHIIDISYDGMRLAFAGEVKGETGLWVAHLKKVFFEYSNEEICKLFLYQ